MTSLNGIRIETLSLPINKLSLEFTCKPDDCKSRREIDNHSRIVLPDGRRLTISNRFWNSWCSLYNQGRSIFDLFSHAEVFDRIYRERGDMVRLAIETNQVSYNEATHGKLLSCTSPKKPLLPLADAVALANKYEGNAVQYNEGIVTGVFDCPFPTPYHIAGEEYKTQFMLQMPVDGYGMPQSYLTLLREICANGMVGMAKAFKTSFRLGKGEDNILEVLDRAMITFSAEEGFHSFKTRLETAAHSWASFNEASCLYQTISGAMLADSLPIKERVVIAEKFDDMCGNPLKYYGLTGRSELSTRRAKTIPVNTTVYEMMTFASEVATHELHDPAAKNRINAWIGSTISNEYDLENTMSEFREWKDFFVK